MILIPDHRHHLIQDLSSTSMVMPPFDVSMPLFTNLGAVYICPIRNYIPRAIHAVSYDTFAPYCHQPLLAPGSVFATVNDSAGITNQQYSSSKTHEDLCIKAESPSPSQTIIALPISDTDAGDANFGTHVDTLMRTIQVKTSVKALSKYSLQEGVITRKESSVANMDCSGAPKTSEIRTKKTYRCDVTSCAKYFFQKTHLDIHMRAHTGYKPFVSSQPGQVKKEVLTRVCFPAMQRADLWPTLFTIGKSKNS